MDYLKDYYFKTTQENAATTFWLIQSCCPQTNRQANEQTNEDKNATSFADQQITKTEKDA